jgi:hypothetical protein
MPYVVLKSIQRVRERGKLVTYHPGDSIEVGRQTAEKWILEGSAYDPYGQVVKGAFSSVVSAKGVEYGVRLLEEESSVSESSLGGLIGKLQVSYGPPECPYPYTFVWKTSKPVSMQLLNYGWLRISEANPIEERWEMAAMLVGLDKVIADVPAEAQTKEETLSVIGDLNVPVYEPRALWCRDTDSVKSLLHQYAGLLDMGVQPHHAFMRALYQNDVALCTLPKDWSK